MAEVELDAVRRPPLRGRHATLQTQALDAIAQLRDLARAHRRPALRFGASARAIVLLHLAERAFAGEVFPFVVLHLDGGHNFPEILRYRDRRVAELDATLVVHPVLAETDADDALVQALAALGLDAYADAAPGALSRSLGARVIAYPLADWADVDVWHYLAAEDVSVPSLLLAHRRAVVRRGDSLVPVTAATPPSPGERLEEISVRLSEADDVRRAQAVASTADCAEAVVAEALASPARARAA